MILLFLTIKTTTKGGRFEVRKYSKNLKFPKMTFTTDLTQWEQHGYLGIASDGDYFEGNFICIHMFKLDYLKH